MYRLISATPSPYARKVRIALTEKQLPFELVTEVPWHATTKTPQHNPLEKLPVLLLPDGGSVYESSFILQYLEWMHPDTPLLPDDLTGKIAARRLEVLCDGVCDALVLTFFERMRGEGRVSASWLARQRRKVDGGLKEMARLVGTGPFAVGGRFSLGDIAAGTVTGYLGVRFPEMDWRGQYPGLAALCTRLEQRPSFLASVPFPQKIMETIV